MIGQRRLESTMRGRDWLRNEGGKKSSTHGSVILNFIYTKLFESLHIIHLINKA